MKTLLIAVGGPTCSGKTLLVKHLKSVFPEGDSFIIHQDDFAPPEADLPYHPDHPEWQDWDYPPTAIEWDRFRSSLLYSKKNGEPSPDVNSHDHLNAQTKVEVSESLLNTWRDRFDGLRKEMKERVVFGLVDGFLLYWDEKCNPLYDVSFFLRVPKDTLRKRRETRAQYVTQTGDVWTDPPLYHPLVVWPAYEFGHRHMFANGDVEQGELIPQIPRWQKDDEQLKGGWAENKIKELAAAKANNKGKGKASDEDLDLAQNVEDRGETIIHEFQPKEGNEGMEEMVDRALGAIFDAVRDLV